MLHILNLESSFLNRIGHWSISGDGLVLLYISDYTSRSRDLILKGKAFCCSFTVRYTKKGGEWMDEILG